MNAVLSRNAPRIDHRAALARQHWTYASGDYAVVGNALQSVSEELCESVNLCQDQRVLDVAAGNFHASLAASRRWCEVTTADHGADLVQRSRQRIEAESMGVRFVDGDVDALPFADQSFDAVVSPFGAMFAADQERAASEMIRVCRRGRQVGLANWTPGGFVGQLFCDRGRTCAAGSRRRLMFAWGTGARLAELFGAYGNLWVTREARRFPQPHADGLGRQTARQLSSRAHGRSRCWMPPGSGRCDPTCWSWWRSSIAPRTARCW